MRIFSIVLDWIATFVSFTLLGCSCFRLLYCYHGHVKFLFLSIARLVSRTPKAFLSIDYYLGILDTFRILFFADCYVSTTHTFRIPFCRLLRWYFAHFKNSPPLDCYVGNSCTLRILFHWIVKLVSPASLDCYVSIYLTLRILLHRIVHVKSVSRAP